MKAQRKARQTRIRLARNATSNAFVAAKKRREQQLDESNNSTDKNHLVNPFELQHHHLLRCLEITTVGKRLFFPFSSNFFSLLKDREFVEMGPDILMSSGGGASLAPGGTSIAGLGRFTSPTSNFLLNRRKWWCCGVPRRKRSSFKANLVSFAIYLNRVD